MMYVDSKTRDISRLWANLCQMRACVRVPNSMMKVGRRKQVRKEDEETHDSVVSGKHSGTSIVVKTTFVRRDPS